MDRIAARGLPTGVDKPRWLTAIGGLRAEEGGGPDHGTPRDPPELVDSTGHAFVS
jgi:hypothetical protein